MPVPDVRETYPGRVTEVTIGCMARGGGTRNHVASVGGACSLPSLDFDGKLGHKPVIAMDVLDRYPADWPDALRQPFGDALHSPADWARRCVDEFGARMICVKLDAIGADDPGRAASDAVAAVESVLRAVSVPLIIWGCDVAEMDNAVLPKVSRALKGERCLIGAATEANYRTLAAACLADGHNIITSAPLDVNMARQINILVSDMDFPLDRIVMYQTTGGLGYGLDYAYSIQERQRLAALGGDRLMAMPVICDVGTEAWRAKEARTPDDPALGPQAERGPLWELVTATTLLQSGVDIFRMRHPRAVAGLSKTIDELFVT